MNKFTSALRLIVQTADWKGAASELAGELNSSELLEPIATAKLATQLRRLESELFWNGRLSLRFTRTGQRRLIHLANRERHAPSVQNNDTALEGDAVTHRGTGELSAS